MPHLRAERPDEVPDLHRRASAWYERDGYLTEAMGSIKNKVRAVNRERRCIYGRASYARSGANDNANETGGTRCPARLWVSLNERG